MPPTIPPFAAGERADDALPTVFMFAGQGSQYHQMGRHLYDTEPIFRDALERLDAAATAELGASVLGRIYATRRQRSEPFDDTLFTHPAIVMVELALAETLTAYGIEPDYLLGASLGEFAAATVAGVLTPHECLRVLVRQARALETCPGGGMLTVLADAGLYDATPLMRDHTEVAARNYDGHFVIAGPEEALAAVAAYLAAAAVPHQPVAVAHAFHSRLMDGCRVPCEAALDGVELRPPRVPIVSCATAGPVEVMSAAHLWRAARQPIDFARTIAALEASRPHRYLDLGPSGTLHGFVRNNLAAGTRSRSYPVLSPLATDGSLMERVRAAYADGRTTHRTRRSAEQRRSGTMKVYGFPGQGSQVRGMGAELFDEFGEHVARADAVLGYSVRRLCLEDPDGQLPLTQFTQPALYVVGALAYLRRLREDPTPPAYLVGHSLGEYVALFAADAFDFETGLRLVRRRGELMSRVAGGGMAAVVGCDLAAVTAALDAPGLADLDIANHNAPDQFVLAGPTDRLSEAAALFEGLGARFVPLNVSAPFHSRYMRPVAEEFGRFLGGVAVHRPALPVLANVDAGPYDPDLVAQTLVRQIVSPVRWVDTIRYLMDRGDFTFDELGPGRVLTTLVTKTRAAGTPRTTAVDPHPPGPRNELASAVPAATAGTVPSAPRSPTTLRAEDLGAATFRQRYGLRYAYLAGSMYHGVSSTDVLTRLADAGAMGFFGTGGLPIDAVEAGLRGVLAALRPGAPFGANLLYQHMRPDHELALVDLLLRLGVGTIEAAGFVRLTPALVKYRLKGGRVLAKVSRADLAEAFLRPAPPHLVSRLVDSGDVTPAEAERATGQLMADDLCVEADQGWQLGTSCLATLLPSVLRLRDTVAATRDAAAPPVHIGAAGGIGTPEAAAAAFMLGADFILTGSVNQCTVEAATSPAVKEMLGQLDVHDVDRAPSSELFELGVQSRVMKRGVFTPARANKLYDLWRRHDSFDEIDPATRSQIEQRYLQRPFPQAYAEARSRLLRYAPDGGPPVEHTPKDQLALVFRGYLHDGMEYALNGVERRRVDYLVYCGCAMGAFNRWVAGTELEPWRARHVDDVAVRLLTATAALLRERSAIFHVLSEPVSIPS